MANSIMLTGVMRPDAHHRELEICAETLHACEAAAKGGADRIELCAALAEGGVTPSLGFLREALAATSLPIHVLLRPRSSDFVYSDAEFRMMCTDADSALSAGAAGIVVGMLTPQRRIDCQRAREFIRLAGGGTVTFHRAFDQTSDLEDSLEVLIDLGFERVLTSGGRPNVTEGREMLTKLTRQAGARIRIAAGGGITLQNAADFTSIPGLDLHASLRAKTLASSNDPLWNAPAEGVSVEAVRSLARAVHEADLIR